MPFGVQISRVVAATHTPSRTPGGPARAARRTYEVQLIGLSCDSVEQHKAWYQDRAPSRAIARLAAPQESNARMDLDPQNSNVKMGLTPNIMVGDIQFVWVA